MHEDTTGSETVKVLDRGIRLANRITGNDEGSLGLHPAVYFYGPSGHHSSPMFMGTVKLIGKKISNNDQTFFKKFTSIRPQLELILIKYKDTIASILQKHISTKRIDVYASLLESIINTLLNSNQVDESFLIDASGLKGKLIIGTEKNNTLTFSENTKSEVFIHKALSSALKCPVCDGYLDAEKSVSYDHIKRVREEGKGSIDNCQLTHPFCNQSVKQ